MGPLMVIGEHGTMTVAVDPTGAVFGVRQPDQHSGSELASDPQGAVFTLIQRS